MHVLNLGGMDSSWIFFRARASQKAGSNMVYGITTFSSTKEDLRESNCSDMFSRFYESFRIDMERRDVCIYMGFARSSCSSDCKECLGMSKLASLFRSRTGPNRFVPVALIQSQGTLGLEWTDLGPCKSLLALCRPREAFPGIDLISQARG